MDDKKKLNLGLAMLPIAAMLLLLIIGYGQLNLRIESLLLISAGITAALAYWQGYRWNDIIDAIVAKLSKAMPVIMILIAALFITSVISVCTNTSWRSAGTVDVALMGVAAGLDVSLAATAGAVVSGAYFGDKISPLSDSTNFAAIVADTDLYSHVQHVMSNIAPQLINIWEKSHKPWSVKNSAPYFIYGNSATKEFTHNIEKLFDCRKPYNHEIP